MNEIIQKAIKDSQRLRRSDAPWILDEPFAQPYNVFEKTASSWNPTNPSAQPEDVQSTTIRDLVVFTWNIDFMLPYGDARMKAALHHLGDLMEQLVSIPSIAPITFLQECTPSDLEVIASTPWVRQRFILTDIDATHWATSHYGTTILLDARLPIISLFRVHYSQTRMDRDAFFVDVALGRGSETLTIRLCNTHLESLAMDPPLRPAQMSLIARFLHAGSLHGAITAGDFNAIQPSDRTLHLSNDLKDAFLEEGGKEDSEEGYTWGQQAATTLREQFGCSRMDKVYFTGGLKMVEWKRFGMGVEILEGHGREEIMGLGFDRPWVTDHLGVVARFEVVQQLTKEEHRL